MDSKIMHRHFTDVASSYNDVRTTDPEPVLLIKEKLKPLKTVRAADIGCGAGRYDLLLLKHMDNLSLTLVDINESMLREAAGCLRENGMAGFETVHSGLEGLSLKPGSYDCMLTFNAIHHLGLRDFIEKTSAFLRKGGLIIIYTRLDSQNRRNVWGRYFPMFHEKETRLYGLDEMVSISESVGSVCIESVDTFNFRRRSSLEQLVRLAGSRHYSTFSLYTQSEFERALKAFRANIARDFEDPDRLEWNDENIMLTLRCSG
jgi:ubiquinone/menaquinone biosynthesis C-methylase UbiE